LFLVIRYNACQYPAVECHTLLGKQEKAPASPNVVNIFLISAPRIGKMGGSRGVTPTAWAQGKQKEKIHGLQRMAIFPGKGPGRPKAWSRFFLPDLIGMGKIGRKCRRTVPGVDFIAQQSIADGGVALQGGLQILRVGHVED